MIFKAVSVLFTAALVCSQEGPSWIADAETEAEKEPQLAPISSFHVPPGLKSDLNLTPTDLKLFSGHALHMLRSKCPAVTGEKLFQIQKYLSKALADGVEETGGVHSQNGRLEELMGKLKDCAKTVDHPPSPSASPGAYYQSLSEPFKFFDRIGANQPAEPINAEMSADAAAEEIAAKTPAPTIRHKESTGHKVAKWFSNIFESIASFFTHSLTQAFSGRKRRSVEDFGVDEPEQSPSMPAVLVVERPGQPIQNLVDEVCRIFCIKCASHNQMSTLQMALRELLDFILKDDNMVLALSSLLDKELLASLSNCGPSELSLHELMSISRLLQKK
jgi:hypothetical protein